MKATMRAYSQSQEISGYGVQYQRGLRVLVLLWSVCALNWTTSVNAQDDLVGIFDQPGFKLETDEGRERVVEELRERGRVRRDTATAKARTMGLPARVVGPNGAIREIAGFDDDEPIYFSTHNTSAAISTNAKFLRETYETNGAGVTIGMWDGGSGRISHQEFDGRMTVVDGATSIDHATHVAGTLAATGVVGNALGMAPSALVDSYDWTDDLAEMASRGATAPGQANNLYLSNHSYGFIGGWLFVNNGSVVWEWYGNGTGATAFEEDFGRYHFRSRDQDALAFEAPYYLIFRSAGNDRVDNPSDGQPVVLAPGADPVVYSASSHPPGDGNYHGGFDSMAFSAVSKNVVTVGSVSDAVSRGVRDSSAAMVSSFSSWGPTDDGRVKPDLVANGSGLYSTLNGSDSSYGSMSGTSMASPNATGTAGLLIELYRSLFSGGAMRSSTLKGLLLHTADDLGNIGPDYRYGWGLMNGKAAADLIHDHSNYPAKQGLTEDEVSTSTTTRTYPFVWDGTSAIQATLCWTDPAGNATSTSDLRTPRLVNNLELSVTAPNGSEFYPFVMPFVGTWTRASMDAPAVTGINHTDNVEQVLIPNPPSAGSYSARVSFTGNLNNGPQAFSLVLSGSADAVPPPPPLAIDSVSPSSGLAGLVTVDLTGTNFQSDSNVKLFRNGETDRVAESVQLIGESLRCTLDMTGATTGFWDASVANSDGETATLTDAFSVIGALWSESFDGSPSEWSSSPTRGNSAWTLTTSQSHSPPTSYGISAPSSPTTTYLTSPSILVPSNANDLQLKFWHLFDLDANGDGGRIQYSVNDGSWTDIGTDTIFASNGYNTTVKSRGHPNSRSDYAGQEAWSGNSSGFVETIVNLNTIALFTGNQLRFRWGLATDGRAGGTGWYVDSIVLIGGGDLVNQPPDILAAPDSSSAETETAIDGNVWEIVRGTETGLSVSATDDGGESNLTYTWGVSASPGSPVFFSDNGTNSAKSSTVSFESLGDHILTVRISDLEGLTVTGEIRARVVSELSGVVISPPAVSLSVNASQDFHAGLVDQFGSSIEDSSTVFVWATGGGGPIDSNGLFTAFQAGGPFGVTATYAGFSGTANVTVTPANATVSLSNLNQDYDGLPKSVVITTDPSGVDVSVTYDGSPDPPVPAGTFSVEAVVTDPNYQGQASGNLSVSSNFLYWQTLEFTQEEIDNGLADPTVDNDEDGLVHLLEYALGTDPNIFTSGLEWHLVDGGNGEPRFELEFTRPIGLPDISYFIDAAESPGSASKETLSNFTISPIENTDMEKVVVRDDLVAPGAVRRFLWLRIERN